jgi:acyl carrier protein
MNSALDHLRRIIASAEDIGCHKAADDITVKCHLKNDLGLDSIALMSIVYELQEIYESLDETELANWQTVEDLLAGCQ